jgi:hypothetical protein
MPPRFELRHSEVAARTSTMAASPGGLEHLPPANAESVAAQRAATVAVPEPEVRVYAHSRMLYWWPVWVCGYTMTLLTHLYGEPHQIGAAGELFHPSTNLGVIFLLTVMLVIVVTNVTVRGLASVVVILALCLAALLVAYFHKWDVVLDWLGQLKIHLNLGAYFWFSTLIFAFWVVSVLIFDHLSYWRITPGQVTHENVFGASSKSYDANNMVLEQLRSDLFRHWFLGFGSGDLQIHPFGAQQDVILVPNVLFLGSKVRRIEHMIATEPDR